MGSEIHSLHVAKSDYDISITARMANRHGLIAGATGTGKTVTLRVMAEGFSRMGVPVFMADAKGDLSGMSKAGTANPKIDARVTQLGVEDFGYEHYPVVFWDILGEQGHPIRTTISDVGPLLLARLLNLNDTQSGVLNIVFRVADDNGMLLLDLKDLRAMVQYVADNASEFKTQYGNIATASIGAIQRGLVTLEDQGADQFFGEPALNLEDFIQTDSRGRGVINILAADKLMQKAPKVYAIFLLWMMAELFEQLPEAGDLDKPKLVFFFDEAHLLFSDAPKALVDQVEQVVRLIRSKGIGIYFVTQNPLDLPETVLGQLGNRVQHALRAFTPRDQKAVRAAAETFRANPKLDVASVIMELGVGEALVSVLDEKGTPTIVERAWILPPRSQLNPLSKPERDAAIQASTIYGHYEKAIDRESAFEKLRGSSAKQQPAKEEAPLMSSERAAPAHAPASRGDDVWSTLAKGAARAIGSQLGRQIMRGVLGSLMGGGSGRRR